jgi:hypothetical protein
MSKITDVIAVRRWRLAYGEVGVKEPGSGVAPSAGDPVTGPGHWRTMPRPGMAVVAGSGQRLGRLNRIPGAFVKQMHARKKYRG